MRMTWNQGMSRSAYKIEDKFAEQERDVKKFTEIKLAVFSLENQTGEVTL